jgi:hypothetical protein
MGLTPPFMKSWMTRFTFAGVEFWFGKRARCLTGEH